MSRKRFITSDMSTDRKLAAVAEENPVAALMWPWFVTALDDWGRMGADPMEVKLNVFPAFPFTSKEIAEAIRLFNEHGLVHCYEMDGKPYLAVKPASFYKYQTYINTARKAKELSKFPAPPAPPWDEQPSSAIIADNLQSSKTIADDQQTLQKIVPSLSLSLTKDNTVESASPGSDIEGVVATQSSGKAGELKNDIESIIAPLVTAHMDKHPAPKGKHAQYAAKAYKTFFAAIENTITPEEIAHAIEVYDEIDYPPRLIDQIFSDREAEEKERRYLAENAAAQLEELRRYERSHSDRSGDGATNPGNPDQAPRPP